MEKTAIPQYRLLVDHKRLRVVLFLLLAICILTVSLIFFSLSINKPFMGIVISKNAQGWEVTSVDSNGLANQVGIREGDTPTLINGQSAPIFLEKYEKVGLVIGVLIKDISVIDENGQIKSVAVQNNLPSWQSITEVATWFIVCVVFWITGFYVLFKKPSHQAALLLCLCGVTFGLVFNGTNSTADGISPTRSPDGDYSSSPPTLVHCDMASVLLVGVQLVSGTGKAPAGDCHFCSVLV